MNNGPQDRGSCEPDRYDRETPGGAGARKLAVRNVRTWRRGDRHAGLDLRPRLDRLAPGRLAIVLIRGCGLDVRDPQSGRGRSSPCALPRARHHRSLSGLLLLRILRTLLFDGHSVG